MSIVALQHRNFRLLWIGLLISFSGSLMAIKGQAPVVPVAISGTRDAMKKGSLIIRPVQVTVSFGAPIATAGRTLDDRDELVGEVRGAVAALLAGEA